VAGTPYRVGPSSSGGAQGQNGAAASLGGVAPAPLSTAKAAHARRSLGRGVGSQGVGEEGSSESDREGDRVELPGLKEEPQTQRQWGVELGGGKGRAKRSKGNAGKKSDAQSTEEVMRAVAELAADRQEQGEGMQQQQQQEGEAGGIKKPNQGKAGAEKGAAESEPAVRVKEEDVEGTGKGKRKAVAGSSKRRKNA